MMSAVLVILVLASGAGLLGWKRQRPRRPAPRANAKRRSWRLVLPRAAGFSLAQATAWFTALAPLLTTDEPEPWMEWHSGGREVELRLGAPAAWELTLRGQLAAWFPEARLEAVPEPEPLGGVAVLPLRLEKPDLFALRFPHEKEPDPVLGLLGVLSQGEASRGVRVSWGAAPADWKAWAPAALQALAAGQRLPPRGGWLPLWRVYRFFQTTAPSGHPARPTAAAKPELARAAAKVQAPVFRTRLVVWAAGPSPAAAQRVQALAAPLQVGFRDPLGNALIAAGAPQSARSEALREVIAPPIALSAAELATLFHVPAPGHPLVPVTPHRQVAPLPRLLRARGSEPEPITWLGEALTPAGPVPFGLALAERRLHTYVVGKTGTGKSTLLAAILRQDLEAGRGVGLLDPHGDLAERVLSLVPPHRDHEVLYFNPADREFPVGFNLLATATPAERPLVASGVVAVFKKLYPEFWGPRLEYILRNAVLALLETPQPSLLALPRLLTDRAFRAQVLTYVHDPLLRSFFREEFDRHDPRWRAEAIAPVLNKVGQFLSSPLVRHVVGQSRPGFSLRELMDSGGIFIANLATGKLGEDNAAMLGGLLVVAFQLAAMARADQPEAARRDFFLVVDEYQHFANDAFGVILSEARKYHLSLTLSHQYLGQLPPALADAVLGNVGSLAVFRVGAPDTVRLVRELAPAFAAEDLVHLPHYHFCARLTHAGETLPAFSARTVPLPAPVRDLTPLRDASRRHWARPRAEVELEVNDFWEGRDE